MADQEIYPKVCFQIFFLDPVLKQKLPPIRRPKYFISIWEKITGDPWVSQVVQGYQIEFVKPFVQTSPARLPALTPAVETVLDQEVKELLEKQAVHPVDHKLQTEGFISSMDWNPGLLKRSFQYSASTLWNDLSTEAKKATNLNEFKRLISNVPFVEAV